MKRTVKKPDDRRREIIEAARELFQTMGYDSMTMQALMRKLNIAKGTIYHYFSSKEALLEAVVEDLIEGDFRKKQEMVNSEVFQGFNALDKFRALVTARTLAEDNEEILEELHQPGNTIMHARQLGRYLTMLAPIFAAVIQEGVEEGVFRTDNPLECAEFLLGGFQFLTDVGFYPWTPEQLARRAQAFPSLIENQLGAPKGSFSFLVEP